jgi:hypothetical protein
VSTQDAKKEIVSKLKDVDNVLVTVSSDPSVDELSAALGFTLLVNKLNKHATAVFSGAIPPAITFLDPTKTFENTVNSLRDFIIALDKEKADHLRYKVDGDMVKIFITPYRTTISDKDLDFSQGDYNVEMVMAIGVRNSDDLDKALTDHGRIMHDATVASLSVGETKSDLGSINWHDDKASSYSELLVGVADDLRSSKNLLDEQIATAFLTGIVAATERFSNDRTNANSMTIAAELMAAGANQQLIATKLSEAREADVGQGPYGGEPRDNRDGTTDLSDDVAAKVERQQQAQQAPEEKPPDDVQAPDGTMNISHEKQGTLDAVTEQVADDNQRAAAAVANAQLEQQQSRQKPSPEADLARELAATAPAQANVPSVADLHKDLEQASAELDKGVSPSAAMQPEMQLPKPSPAVAPNAQQAPSLGGVLNATTNQAAEDARRTMNADHNRTILSHGGSQYVGNPPASHVSMQQMNSNGQPEMNQTDSDAESLSASGATLRGRDLQPPSQQPLAEPTAPQQTLADIDLQHRAHETDPREAIAAALSGGPSTSDQRSTIPDLGYEEFAAPTKQSPAPQTAAEQPRPQPQQGPEQIMPQSSPDDGGLPPLPPLPDFSKLPPEVNTTGNGGSGDDRLGSALPPLEASLPPEQAPPAPKDPGQFQIPGQN